MTIIKNSIAKIEKMNGKKLSEQSQRRLSEMLLKMEQNVNTEQHKNQGGEEVTLKDAFIHPVMRPVIMIMALNWMVVTLGYFGISMIAVNLGSNAYISSILTALIEIPSYIFCIICMDKLGRKPICVFCFFLTGISCIVAGLPSWRFSNGIRSLGQVRRLSCLRPPVPLHCGTLPHQNQGHHCWHLLNDCQNWRDCCSSDHFLPANRYKPRGTDACHGNKCSGCSFCNYILA